MPETAQVNVDALKAAVALCQSFARSRSPSELARCVHLCPGPLGLELRGTDFSAGVGVGVPSEGVVTGGVDADRFARAVARLTGETATLTKVGTKLCLSWLVKGIVNKFDFAIAAYELPLAPTPPKDVMPIAISGDDLALGIRSVAYAGSTDDKRLGVRIEPGDASLTFAATNGSTVMAVRRVACVAAGGVTVVAVDDESDPPTITVKGSGDKPDVTYTVSPNATITLGGLSAELANLSARTKFNLTFDRDVPDLITAVEEVLTVMVPQDYAVRLADVADGADGSLWITDRTALWRGSDRWAFAPIMEGRSFPVVGVMATEFAAVATFDRAEILARVKDAQVAIDSGVSVTKGVTFAVSGGRFAIATSGKDDDVFRGECESDAPVSEIVSAKQLMDALSNAPGEKVRIGFNGVNRPTVVDPGSEYEHAIMAIAGTPVAVSVEG